MPEWLHTLYDAGMTDVDITSMIALGVAQSMRFALQDRDVFMMTKLLEWSPIADKCMYDSIDKSLEKK